MDTDIFVLRVLIYTRDYCIFLLLYRYRYLRNQTCFGPVLLSIMSTCVSVCVCTSCWCWCLMQFVCTVCIWIGLCRLHHSLLNSHPQPPKCDDIYIHVVYTITQSYAWWSECECAHNCKCECVSKATYAFVHFPAAVRCCCYFYYLCLW